MDPSTPRKRILSRGRRVLLLVAVLFSTGLIGLLAAYGTARYLLTPQWVRAHLVPRIERNIGRKVVFKDLQVSGGDMVLTGVHLSESPEFSSPKDGNIVVVERIELSLDKSALLGLRLVIDRLDLVRPYVRLGRIDDARWNITELIREMGALGEERTQVRLQSEPASAWSASGALTRLGSMIPKATQLLIREISIADGILLVEDSVALFDRYSHVVVRNISAQAEPFTMGQPIRFHLDGEIRPADDNAWTLGADASYDLAENLLDVDARLSTFDPDIIVSMLARPLRLAPKPPKPEPEKPFQLTVDVAVDEVPYWRIQANDVTGRVEFARKVLKLENLVGTDSGGDLTVNGTIRFEPAEVHHDLDVVLVDASFNKEIGYLLPPPWNEIVARQTLEVSGKFRDPRGHPFMDALLGKSVKPAPGEYVRANVTLTAEVLDLDEMIVAIRSREGESEDVQALSTGWIDADVAVDIDRLRFRQVDFHDVAAKGTLHDSTLELASLESAVEGGGDARMSGHLLLNEPGFRYDTSLQLTGVDHAVMLRSVADSNWGERSGTADADLTLAGQGTTAATALPALEGALEVNVRDGHIRGASFLDVIAQETGIEGFRNMELVESGGIVTLSDSVLRTSQVRLGSEEARILMKGRIGLDETLDLKVKLGFGPNSQRRLMSKGVLLPYQYDDEGWTEIPLFVSGTFQNPTIIPDPAAVASTALHAVPDTAKRLGKGGADVTGAVVGGAYGSVEAIAGGLGRVFTGNWGESEEPEEPEQTH